MHSSRLIYLIILNLCFLPCAKANLESQLKKAETAADTTAIIEIARRMLDKNPEDLILLRKIARAQLKNDSFSACKKTLVHLSSLLRKEDAEVLEMFGDIELKKSNEPKDSQKALVYWKRALQIDPDRVSVLVRLVEYQCKNLNKQKEAAYLKKLVQLTNDPENLSRIINLNLRNRDWDAIDQFTKRLRASFPSSDQAKKWNPSYDKLLKIKMRLINIDSSLSKGLYMVNHLLERAWIFNELFIDQLAIEDAERALEIRPDSLWVKYQLGIILANAGKAKEASDQLGLNFWKYSYKRTNPGQQFLTKLHHLEKTIAEKGNVEALSERAEILYREGQTDLAIADLQMAMNKNTDHIPSLLLFANIQIGKSKTKDAQRALQRILNQESDPVTYISSGHRWKYLDNGSNQEIAWRTKDFDDSTWSSGPSELGYGSNDEGSGTTLSFGPDSSSKYPTTYFRTSVKILDPSLFSNFLFRVKYDDGIAVYINGKQAIRQNLAL
ncbi:MAG: hypothetical protein GWP42_00945 [Verrucomicrobiales bacterium]|nr:hypothetical protein [Verrucomicrobiales bacterium]